MSTPDLPASTSPVARTTMRVASTWSTMPGAAGGDRRAGIARDGLFHAGADERRLGADQRHRLALHVRAHQRAVGVVVLEERDQRGGDRDELLGADVHQRDRARAAPSGTRRLWRAETSSSTKLPSVSSSAIGLRDRVLRLFHRREVDDVVGDLAVDDLAVRRLDEAVLVDPAEGRRAS